MKFVVLGASAAGLHGAAALRDRDRDSVITLISEDALIYSRCILHQFIAGERSAPGLAFMGDRFIEKNRILWKPGLRAIGLARAEKKVLLSDGSAEPYDRLLIATGASTAFPPVKGLREAPRK
ncbi:MAG: FAD-dependent oxidoreductase [Spirochaetaceae bacterium]|nr:FAD-dependent oxidoreductase [Spirochaetaceae bacterium]